MKKLLTFALILACTVALSSNAGAVEKKPAKKPAKSEKAAKPAAKKPSDERTIRGELVCAHCSLGIGDGCQNAIKVSRKGKDGKEIQAVYLLTGDAADSLGKGDGQMVIAKGKVKREGKGKEAKLYLATSSLQAVKKK